MTVKKTTKKKLISTIHLAIVHFSATQRFYLRYEWIIIWKKKTLECI